MGFDLLFKCSNVFKIMFCSDAFVVLWLCYYETSLVCDCGPGSRNQFNAAGTVYNRLLSRLHWGWQ